MTLKGESSFCNQPNQEFFKFITVPTMRLIYLQLAVLFIAISFCSTSNQVAAQSINNRTISNPNVAQLEDRLRLGLRIRKDDEQAYIDRVVKLVREGKLPQKLVDTTFLWVRKKRPDTNFPLIYFRRVLKIRADALNITVPN